MFCLKDDGMVKRTSTEFKNKPYTSSFLLKKNLSSNLRANFFLFQKLKHRFIISYIVRIRPINAASY